MDLNKCSCALLYLCVLFQYGCVAMPMVPCLLRFLLKRNMYSISESRLLALQILNSFNHENQRTFTCLISTLYKL